MALKSVRVCNSDLPRDRSCGIGSTRRWTVCDGSLEVGPGSSDELLALISGPSPITEQCQSISRGWKIRSAEYHYPVSRPLVAGMMRGGIPTPVARKYPGYSLRIAQMIPAAVFDPVVQKGLALLQDDPGSPQFAMQCEIGLEDPRHS
jgi:hypothetical protein